MNPFEESERNYPALAKQESLVQSAVLVQRKDLENLHNTIIHLVDRLTPVSRNPKGVGLEDPVRIQSECKLVSEIEQNTDSVRAATGTLERAMESLCI